jgi:hypothetical protein
VPLYQHSSEIKQISRIALTKGFSKSSTELCITIFHCSMNYYYYVLINLFFMQQLVGHLTRDFIREGWLYKTGPRSSDAYKKRWFTLDNRKLMYHDDPLVRKILFR